ncbi:protein deglycase YajL [Chimaeribacter arupi]|uniref:Protein deglycase YajL n=2 Tax=Yersiniaceae TaxID=1903411 RepID=A0A2N5EQP3_9GAMM|nr:MULTISPECIES: protein deglycase YajL [Yersiniaceae]MBS0968257.1 protein deglycase YajL [Nissabacter archeti]MDV5139455.1 protein deglycase YajL [Chimaeribacter arupi]PLR38056.1 protein deglycase YajL [Chimaeribacter arupi]PLR43967.1 protein deglycase YajL [Chimaeribacter arupi]PLR46114.1 protein deglycase YajL [Chimaeribacter arupi]
MSVTVLVCLAPGSEETEAVTVIDLLVRAGATVTTASVAGDGARDITCSRGVRLLADTTLVAVADDPHDAIVLPGGGPGAECFRDSPLLVEKVRQMHTSGKLVAAICAAPALVLEHHQLFPIANMTGFPALKDKISPEKWMDKRVVYDPRVNLLTSQGPGTSMDFALKLIDLLLGKAKAAEVAAQLVLAPGIYDYQDHLPAQNNA